MANRLKNLIITKVALCPKGQNPDADIVFFKSDETPVAPVGPVIQKAFNALTTFFAKDTFNTIRADRQRFEATMEAWSEVTKSLDDLRSALASSILWPMDAPNVPEATKSISQFSEAVDSVLRSLSKEDNVKKDYSKMSPEELKKELEDRDATTPPETVSKEDLANLQKALDLQAEEIKKANEAVAKAQEEARVEKEKREKIEAIEKGKRDFPNLPLTDEEKGALVQSMAKMDAAASNAMIKALNAGNAALKDLGKSVGQETGAELETAKDKLKKAAEALMAADPKLSYAVAYDQACQKNAELYKEARAEA